MKDFARVAQLSAEEAFRLLLTKQKQDEQNMWARFENEVTKRVGEIKARHNECPLCLGEGELKRAEVLDRVAWQVPS